MSAWLGVELVGGSGTDPEEKRRWQAECERAGGDCASRAEALVLRMWPAQVARRGDTLRIFTAAGEIGFRDLPAQSTHHRYLGLLERSGHHLLWQRLSDGDRFLLLSDRTAQQTVVHGLPRVSPDQRSLVVVSDEHHLQAPALALFRIEAGQLTSEFVAPNCPTVRYDFLGWNGPDRVQLELQRSDGLTTHPPLRALSRDTDGWRLI
jgi:hypothetical protein